VKLIVFTYQRPFWGSDPREPLGIYKTTIPPSYPKARNKKKQTSSLKYGRGCFANSKSALFEDFSICHDYFIFAIIIPMRVKI